MKFLLFSIYCYCFPVAVVDALFTTNVCFRTVQDSGSAAESNQVHMYNNNNDTTAGVTRPITGALVRCFDRDWGRNDRVGQDAHTNNQGCVSITDEQYWMEAPDLFCVVYATGDGCFSTTPTPILYNHPTATSANFGIIDVPYDARNCWTPANVNGCGSASMPSFMRTFLNDASGMEKQCNAHDACYASCGSVRSDCDLYFYKDMVNICMGRWACQITALAFHWTVSFLGQFACRQARQQNQCSSLAECNL
jgi:hypothetical protein